MTIRLSAMFEELMRRVIYNWKSSKRRALNVKNAGKAKGKSKAKRGKKLTNGAGEKQAFLNFLKYCKNL